MAATGTGLARGARVPPRPVAGRLGALLRRGRLPDI